VRLTRRSFVRAAAGSLLVPRAGFAQSPAKTMTAGQVAERIRANAGMAWRDKTLDGFKAGSPDTPVTGVVTTVMATQRVLARAVELERNLIVTQEPVFYNANDEPGNRASDATYLAKKAYIEQHGLVVFRFADHWNARQPDPRVAALARALSWEGPGTNGVFPIRETTLSSLAAHLRDRLQIRGGLRTVGAPAMRVRSALLIPGTTDVPAVMARLKDADVVVAGEPREWEVVPYLLDGREAGANKALLAVGRLVSEEPGMKACADWLKALLPEVPVDAVPVGDPYWSPLA
jgi:putative NIF3 family GTP cyclohydrolase 1 type 2